MVNILAIFAYLCGGLPAGIFTIDALTWVYVGIFRPECCGLRELIHVLLMLVISNQPKNSNDQ